MKDTPVQTSPLSVSGRLYNQFRDLVYKQAGIHLGDNKQALLGARLSKRLRALGLGSFEEYYDYVRDDTAGNELVHLLDVVSTNVTQFYREARHFEVLAETLAAWKAAGRKRYRIWCAASSSGEEPYTLAITAREALGPQADVKILATDISTRVLETARRGRYDNRKLAAVPRNLLAKYFVRSHEPGCLEVGEELRRTVQFNRLNLAEPPFPMRGPLDVIMCRNVMIYFDNAVRQRLVSEMERLLVADGILFVGHAETLAGIETKLGTVSPSVYKLK
ncbi:MAG: CheR family methyltransferase [Lentisphaeria bacterium]|jgi:chemotaxis protein methyltransferase CheR|nr:CheR family methyltransferase [Lentisphaeria bacterium]